jgi:hypothetical protein
MKNTEQTDKVCPEFWVDLEFALMAPDERKKQNEAFERIFNEGEEYVD